MHNYYAQPIYYTDVSKCYGSLTDWSIPLTIRINLREKQIGKEGPAILYMQRRMKCSMSDVYTRQTVSDGNATAGERHSHCFTEVRCGGGVNAIRSFHWIVRHQAVSGGDVKGAYCHSNAPESSLPYGLLCLIVYHGI